MNKLINARKDTYLDWVNKVQCHGLIVSCPLTIKDSCPVENRILSRARRGIRGLPPPLKSESQYMTLAVTINLKYQQTIFIPI